MAPFDKRTFDAQPAMEQMMDASANKTSDPIDLWDVISSGLERDGNFAVREHLASGRSVYYVDDDTPDGLLIKEHPDGRRELVRFRHEGDEVARTLTSRP